ncbi:hypothetical protein P280DRAFT_151893 [Massarina eburnea CBS 473.64]|uniref:Gag1-like clamp domain-containing protein n=1 Tax=Massarina eburnea CBS 473.64 TaxID=1395130 RepID=A0A6A6RM59_9PLEO|nr:hypothetical protein P280DRAFT_151893 [Massarina eburnea CBS 473.64]
MQTDQSAASSARRFLHENIRNDWEWPDVPPCREASDEEVRSVSSFRERYYGTSSPGSSEEEEGTEQGPYQFDSPDSIGETVERKAERRKRKKRQALAEEMKENAGLRMFVQQRDRWTGADSVRKYGTPARKEQAAPQTNPAGATDGDEASPAASLEASSSDASTPANDSCLNPCDILPPPDDALIPVAPTLLANNSIRKSITPKTYADIYSKIVLQSRTPSVPINLADMSKVLVQGWKESGEWPPRAAPLDPLAGKKRALAGISLVGKTETTAEPFLSHHPHLQKGVEGMKKMLHFGGGGGAGGTGNAG